MIKVPDSVRVAMDKLAEEGFLEPLQTMALFRLGVAGSLCRCPKRDIAQHARAPHGPKCSFWEMASALGVLESFVAAEWDEARWANDAFDTFMIRMNTTATGHAPTGYDLGVIERTMGRKWRDILEARREKWLHQPAPPELPMLMLGGIPVRSSELVPDGAPFLINNTEVVINGATQTAGVQGGREPRADRGGTEGAGPVGDELGEGGERVP